MNSLSAIIDQRRSARLQQARDVADHVLRDAQAAGIDMRIVGSLARGDFKEHSDIDFLVQDEITPERRMMIERLVAAHLRNSALPYDLIFAADLTAARLEEMLHDCL